MEELVVLPEQVRLTLDSRPDYESESFRAGYCFRGRTLYRSLEKAVFACIHPEKQTRIRCFEDICARREVSEDGILPRQPGGEVMRCAVKAIDRVLMTRATCVITSISIPGIQLPLL